MEKENKIIIITEELRKQKKDIKYDCCYTRKTKIKELKKQLQNKKTITIFDITHSQTKNKNTRIRVNDHINKTGENPLLSCHPIKFIDLTGLYKKDTKGTTTTCLGKKDKKEKKQHLQPSTDLCIVAILCKKIKPDATIQGVLINT